MSEPRKAPFDRLLRLVLSLSESTEGLTLDEMAEVLGQGRRSAERARDVIALHFDLDEVSEGARKRFRIVDGLRRHFTRPSAEEIAALRAEVEALRPGAGIRFRELQSLLAKVQSSFDDREKRRIEPDLEELLKRQRSFVGPGPVAEIDQVTSRAVMDSIMSGLCLEFDYQSADAAKPEWRKIACAGLLNGPISYLVGLIPGPRRSPAIYRLDRITNARLTDEIARIPDDFDLDDWLAEGFGIWREEARRIVLRIRPEAADRARSWRFHPKQETTEQEDGSLIIRFRAGGLREIAEHLFQWVGELVIEEPDELKNEMRERLSLARAMTGDEHAG
jgi:predicted DNA-binding transcriptional regulator YafY